MLAKKPRPFHLAQPVDDERLMGAYERSEDAGGISLLDLKGDPRYVTGNGFKVWLEQGEGLVLQLTRLPKRDRRGRSPLPTKKLSLQNPCRHHRIPPVGYAEDIPSPPYL